VIAKQQTGLAAPHVAILWRIDRPERGNNSVVKAAMLPIVLQQAE
jgi:hypothetical protein